MTDTFSACSTVKSPPLIKWPGGKRELLKSILPLLRAAPKRYFEPFVGGAALFFALQPPSALLSDTNEELINLYRQVRNAPDDLIKVLEQFENSEKSYYKVRASKFDCPVSKAARLLYLTKLSFNGIHRVNLKGEFNVPYGHKSHVAPCNQEQIRSSSRALRTAKLKVCDFEVATADAKKGDLIYFDPPYTVAHANNGFIKYNEKIFSWDDQRRLAAHAVRLAKRGCHVVVSNATHYSIAELYADFDAIVAERFSRIAASSAHRRVITESIYYRMGR
jgi:DNA adenine methylase